MPARARRRSRAAVAALAVLTPVLAAGCTAEPEASDRPVVVFLGGADEGSRHYEADAEALRAALRADCEDCEYAAFDAAGDADLQADQMARALDGGADAVLLEAVADETGEQLVAEAGDVPVVTMDRFVAGADFHVGYAPDRSGRRLARAALNELERRGDAAEGPAGALFLGAGAGDVAGTRAADAARDLLVEDGAEVLARVDPPSASTEAARTWTADQIGQRPVDAVDLVVTSDESQAEGVAAAYEEADVAVADRPLLVGVGADLDALRRLVLEQQAVALRRDRTALVRRVVATAAEVLEGAPVTGTRDYEQVPSFLGTPVPVTLRSLTTIMVRDGTVTTAELCRGATAEACATSGIG